MNVYGSRLPRQAFLASLAGSAMVDIVVVGDSNVNFGSSGQRGLQGGLVNAVANDPNLNNYGSGVVSAALNDGSGLNVGNDPALGDAGWRCGGSGTTAYVDMIGAPAGALALLDAREYSNLLAGPLFLDTGESLSATHFGNIQIGDADMDAALTFSGRYWQFASGGGTMGLSIRRFGTPWTKYASVNLPMNGATEEIKRFTLNLPAGSRPGVQQMQCTYTNMASQGWDGKLFQFPNRAYYTDGVAGPVAVTPLNWFGGASLQGIGDDLVSTAAKRAGVRTVLEEVVNPSVVLSKNHYTVFVVTSLVNDRGDSTLSNGGVAASNTTAGYIDNLLYLRERLFDEVPAGSTPCMIVVPTPPTEYANDTTTIRAAVADYCRANPSLGMVALNFDEETDAATMRAAGYYDISGQTAHMSAAGYDWQGAEILNAIQNGALLYNTPRSRATVRKRQGSLRTRP